MWWKTRVDRWTETSTLRLEKKKHKNVFAVSKILFDDKNKVTMTFDNRHQLRLHLRNLQTSTDVVIRSEILELAQESKNSMHSLSRHFFSIFF